MSAKIIVRTCFFVVICLLHLKAAANKKLTENYISTYSQIAVSEMKRTGIPASIKLAQGILESDLGRSPLAFEANNHFGIKCGKDWNGSVYYKHDDEFDSSGMLTESCFRAYTSADESYRAHSDFLTNPQKQSRYGFLFELGTTDYVGWANGLKFSGYATDPAYPGKLIRIIEMYHLYKFDEPILLPANKSEVVADQNSRNTGTGKAEVNREKPSDKSVKVKDDLIKSNKVTIQKYAVSNINNVRKVNAFGGETISELASKVGLNVFDLLIYNEGLYYPDVLLNAGDIIYLEKKKKSYQDESTLFHTVIKGETMYMIAQKYGIRLENLLSKNNLSDDALPLAGEKISLQKNISKKDTPKYRIIEKFDSFVSMAGSK